MDDDTHAMLVQWGKQEATDEDYVSVAITRGLEEYLDSKDWRQKVSIKTR